MVPRPASSHPSSRRTPGFGALIFYSLFGLLAVVIGGGIVLWVLWNLLIERAPEYDRAPKFGLFGIAPALLYFGFTWLGKARDVFRGMRKAR
jgi:hypothetical protein